MFLHCRRLVFRVKSEHARICKTFTQMQKASLL